MRLRIASKIFKKRGLTPTVSDISNYTSISVKCVEEDWIE